MADARDHQRHLLCDALWLTSETDSYSNRSLRSVQLKELYPVLATESNKHDLASDKSSIVERVLPAELDFYGGYDWSLNPHLLVREAVEYLGDELAILPFARRDWRINEVATNVYLLSCGLLNCIDEYLRGPGLRLPSRLAGMRAGRAARWMAENLPVNQRPRRRAYVGRWRERWLAALNGFLSTAIVSKKLDAGSFDESRAKLVALLKSPLPPDLQVMHIGVPSPFRRLDLTHHDVMALGEYYVQRFPDRLQAILLVGLRTSGSYFTPLLRAYFVAQGYDTVSMLTIAPSKGPGRRERKQLKRYAARGYTAVIVDDPPHTGGAIYTALEIARRAGFSHNKMRVLVPTHPARRHLFKTLPSELLVSLEPEQWHKRKLLTLENVQGRLVEYFGNQNFSRIEVSISDRSEEMNVQLQASDSDERGARLKRIFEVRLETPQGQKQTKYVLAKSVGWGWLGYHAFLAGQSLSGFVPAILGLRDGILYMEWIPNSAINPESLGKTKAHIETAASYIAARTRHLSFGADSADTVERSRQNNGAQLLRNSLSNAYGAFPVNVLTQSRLGRLLRYQHCPLPTFIDGNMQSDEWIIGRGGLIKTDYEHHGLGKEELNVVDPAYDLADTILHWELSVEEERRLIRRYVKESGDIGVEQRLLFNKLLAGLWAMKRAHDRLFGKAAIAGRQQVFHRQFMAAWDFLTVQAARYCGRQCHPKKAPRWRSPLVLTDIDGVLDRRLFGFPTTTAAGIEALSLLHAKDFSVAVNTARSVSEVKAYCEAYSLAGGIAEHGSYAWDAVDQRGRILISPQSVAQLVELKKHLQQIPGVFLDHRHLYSIRAFTYKDKPRGLKEKVVKFIRSSGVGDAMVAPLSTLLVQHLITELGLDRLSFHQTVIDTTIVAKEVNKGTGLIALRDWVLGEGAETIAIGDQEPDLMMFRAATRSFAPANIGCAREARLVGCQIAGQSYQRGLLEIARTITKLDACSCEAPPEGPTTPGHSHDLFLDILKAADQKWSANLKNAVFRLLFSRVRRAKRISN
jgi:hydroxymethylpyrimidine pyrophosphatase-like HAD family hydrolase